MKAEEIINGIKLLPEEMREDEYIRFIYMQEKAIEQWEGAANRAVKTARDIGKQADCLMSSLERSVSWNIILIAIATVELATIIALLIGGAG